MDSDTARACPSALDFYRDTPGSSFVCSSKGNMLRRISFAALPGCFAFPAQRTESLTRGL